jgi:hypothetical protein
MAIAAQLQLVLLLELGRQRQTFQQQMQTVEVLTELQL